jgi:RNA polymerase sigma factor, sigma-70 family
MNDTREFHRNSDLLRRARDGDTEAVEALMQLNLGLVRSIAIRFKDRGTEFDDLMQIGSIGMLKAIRSFDFSRGTVFSTYAVPLIIGEIRRFLRDDGIIKVSRVRKKQGAELMRAREKFMSQHDRDPQISELAAMCAIPIEEAIESLEATSPVHSISESLTPNSADDYTLEDTLTDPSETFADKKIEEIALNQALNRLSPLHRKIVLLRYFRDLSQQQTAARLGLTQVKISREEKKIFEILRTELR